MGTNLTNQNSFFKNAAIAATFGASILSPIEIEADIQGDIGTGSSSEFRLAVTDNWEDLVDYRPQETPTCNYTVLNEFAVKMIQESKDLEDEYMRALNENFWDLL
jgi:hypothetical protein